MSETSYDKSSIKSITLFAQSLIGKSLSEVIELPSSQLEHEDKKNKGNLGKLVEKYFFQHEPPNDDAPDFPDANLELKVTGVVKNKSSRGINGFKAKERLVLKNIHFGKIQKEVWEDSAIMRKCQNMLILFYFYSKDTSAINRVFVLKPLLSFFPNAQMDKAELDAAGIFAVEIPKEDVAQMKRDWEFIQKKVLENQAHTISEGDTKYLKACRKGTGGEKEKMQRYISVQHFKGEQYAPTRAFALPASYINTLINAKDKKVFKLGVTAEVGFEEITQQRLRPFIGCTIKEIAQKINIRINERDKAFRARLVNAILSNGGNSVEELVKSGINVKTVVVDSRLMPKESMSFPSFDYCEIVNQEFEDSDFFEKIESTFLFVIFKKVNNGDQILEMAFYWNMPYLDRVEAFNVWKATKELVSIGDYENLPRSSQNSVAHVRQHARNKKDKSPTPQGGYQVKRCFWLNREYIGKIVNDVKHSESRL